MALPQASIVGEGEEGSQSISCPTFRHVSIHSYINGLALGISATIAA